MVSEMFMQGELFINSADLGKFRMIWECSLAATAGSSEVRKTNNTK